MLNGCDLNIESIIEPKNNIEITTFSARFYVDGTLYHESMESSDKKSHLQMYHTKRIIFLMDGTM